MKITKINDNSFNIILDATELRQLQYTQYLAHKTNGNDEVSHKFATDMWEACNAYHNDTSELLSFAVVKAHHRQK